MGLDISTFHPVLGDYLAQAVVIFGKQLTYSLAPVAHELLAAGGAPDDTACKHGQPGKQVVASACLELLRKRRSPGCRSCLVTVYKKMCYALRAQHSAGCILIHVQILVEIPYPGSLVEFVDFQPGGIGRRRMIHLPGKGGAEAVETPAPGRKLAVKHAVRVHTGGQHQHMLLRRIGVLLDHRSGETVEIVAVGESGLFFHMLQTPYRKQLQIKYMFALHTEKPCLGSRDVHCREILRRLGDLRYRLPGLAVVAALDFVGSIKVSLARTDSRGKATQSERQNVYLPGEFHCNALVAVPAELGAEFFHALFRIRQFHCDKGDVISEGRRGLGLMPERDVQKWPCYKAQFRQF